MRLGIIGRGPWGNVYAQTLERMGIAFWQQGLDWTGELDGAAGVIVASSARSHYDIALELIEQSVPVLIEKPMCMSLYEAEHLLDLAQDTAIVFTGHTRLYSTAWREFKAKALAAGVKSVLADAGGPCKLDPLWDWGPHLVAMCLDLGFDPLKASLITGRDEHPITLIVNKEMAYIDRPADTPRPLEVLLTEFIAAIEKGEKDIRGLEIGVKVVQAIEQMEQRRKFGA